VPAMASSSSVSIGAVFFLTVIMALASALGAAPFFFVGRLSPRWSGIANAVACGVMLAASFDLVHDGEPYGGVIVVLGVCFGALFIARMHYVLHGHEDVRFAGSIGADAKKNLLMIGIMTAHALGEGCGVGVSFSGTKGWMQGQLVALAIGIHNIPEGMAVAAVLHSRGAPPWTCVKWAVVTSIPQPVIAVPSFIFVEAFQSLLPFGLGFAAGCMIWIVCAELLPEAVRGAGGETAATSATLAAAALEGFRLLTNLLGKHDQYLRGTGSFWTATGSGLGGEKEHFSVAVAAEAVNISVVDVVLPMVAPSRISGLDSLVPSAIAVMTFPLLLVFAVAFLPNLLKFPRVALLFAGSWRATDRRHWLLGGGGLVRRHENFNVAKTLGASSGLMGVTSGASLVSIFRRCSADSALWFSAAVGIIAGGLIHTCAVSPYTGAVTGSISHDKKSEDGANGHTIVGWVDKGSGIRRRDLEVLSCASGVAEVARAGVIACVLLFVVDGATLVNAMAGIGVSSPSASFFHSAPNTVAAFTACISAGVRPRGAACIACAVAAAQPMTIFCFACFAGGRVFGPAMSVGIESLSAAAAATAAFWIMLPTATKSELNPGRAHEGMLLGGAFASSALMMSWLSCWQTSSCLRM
jgi:zinc transporter ZupT